MEYCTQVPSTIIPAVRRIIVIGDIHGDWTAYKSSLKAAGVTNHHNDWTGGDTHVVQVGDIVDRKSRNGTGDEKSESKILRHLFDLKAKARQAGGDVHMLLGNHELMNVMGDFRYVSPMGMTDFDGKREQYFRPGGKMAKKLACNTNAVLKIGSWLFSHAGVKADLADLYSLEEINMHVRDFMLGKKTLNRDDPIMDIFWHRDYSNSNPGYCKQVQKSLDRWQAKNMAVGHTVQEHGINGSCSDSLWRVDVGASAAFSTQQQGESGCYIEVLEILHDGDQIRVIKGSRPCKRN